MKAYLAVIGSFALWGSLMQRCSHSCNREPLPSDVPVVAFYNVENLFDTFDDPRTHDEEFTPTSDKEWTARRYQRKLNDLVAVIAKLGPPLAVGLAEVENEDVVADLAAAIKRTTGIAYGWVHSESPDPRGIDVALLYRYDSVEAVLTQKSIPVRLSTGATRDILHAALAVRWGGVRDTLHFFVNHWPSRRGGKAATAPKRAIAARVLRNAVARLLRRNPRAEVIVMGDFNDEPTDESIYSVLGARFDDSGFLINLMEAEMKSGWGSHRYRSAWGVLDQLMATPSVLEPEGLYVHPPQACIARWDILLEKDERYGGRKPRRTYYGPQYHGGVSDHLPVYVVLRQVPRR